MSRIFIFLVAIVAVLFVSTHGQQCGVNEQFNSCGSACEPSCSQPSPQLCTMQCIIGCQCKEGYLRNAAGSCVSPQDC
ncbi:chymotrypsin inhibitor-like [Nomia melanderi]|uniref:chymotrypsin inhibitor-like n=1 Tax=Nomia melanderi TaxID=2448451 RepID=UPI0013044123|nr:chymotrypsin inhibitor-like [Nomia melanderi]